MSSPQIRGKSTPIVSGRGMRASRSADRDNSEDAVPEFEKLLSIQVRVSIREVAEVDDRKLNKGEVDG